MLQMCCYVTLCDANAAERAKEQNECTPRDVMPVWRCSQGYISPYIMDGLVMQTRRQLYVLILRALQLIYRPLSQPVQKLA